MIINYYKFKIKETWDSNRIKNLSYCMNIGGVMPTPCLGLSGPPHFDIWTDSLLKVFSRTVFFILWVTTPFQVYWALILAHWWQTQLQSYL